ncbi:MAG TPA: Glu/Leu/Phe/Val dehydrogenase [Candidatus Saccharimonadales bacterium]|nr:Glu/Leu/Phe/Val dehydrogenase [Candidatus Saccharimonadales bacterium]
MILTAQKLIEKAGELLGLSKQEVDYILQIDQEHVFDIVLKSGKAHRAYRVQHNNSRGPYKGGIRFHPEVDLNEVRALSILMSLKTAAVGLPLGGGKGGVAVDPRDLSEDEIEELSRAYVRHLHPHIGPDKDVPAPDVNTNSQIIDWMVEEYEMLTGDKTRASFTGKSIGKGGSFGREAATGRGGMISIGEYLRLSGKDPQKLTFAVQGVGNVGSFFTKLAETELKGRVVAVSDSRRTLVVKDFKKNKHFISLEGLENRKRGLIDDLASPHVEFLDRDAILELPVDVLVLAALGDTVVKGNAEVVKAPILLELANGPVDEDAFNILTAKGTVIIPDIIANAGGVIVSYLEWLQNKKGETWPESKVNDELAEYMIKATREVYEYSIEHGITVKEAALALAMKRLLDSRKLSS